MTTDTAPPAAAPATIADIDRNRIPPDSPLAPYIWVDAGRLSGEPCFAGTRVPVKILFDHLRAGDPLSEFLEGFPPVTREQAVGVIDLAWMGLLQGLRIL